MMQNRLIKILVIALLFTLTACSLRLAPALPTKMPGGPGTDDTSVPTLPEPTAAPPTVPSPTFTTSLPPMLTLDKNYFCNHGPGTTYTDIVDYPTGTVLPIIGSDGGGWWLVAIADERTHHTECWIGGGIPSGDFSTVPLLPAPGGFVPVHDESNWEYVIYLDCSELDHYVWIWNGYSSGEYVSTTPILGIARPTIVYDQWIPICPGWFPPPAVQVRDEDTWTVVGYLTCAQLELYVWTWNGASSGEYYANVSLFGSDRPTIYMGDVTPICPGFSP
jgi:hypothetical protein